MMAFALNVVAGVKLIIVLIIVSTCNNLCILTASIGENSGNGSGGDEDVKYELSDKPKLSLFNINDSLHQDQVCPSITTEDLGRDTGLAALYPISIITVNLPKLHEADRRNNDDFPCNFKVRGYGHVTNIGVRAIHYTTTPWNFYKSSNCDSFIKFRVPDPPEEKEPDDPYIICRIWKLSLGQKNPIHPILWHLSQKNLAISFPPRGNATESRAESQPHSTYLQIVFTVSSGESCSIRVQQYLVDENNEGCNATYIPPRFRSCGTYRCSDNIHLMNQLGSWTYINWGTQSEFEPPRAPVLRSRMYENGYVRRRTYWFTALVRSSVVPILFFGMILLGYKFFCVLYPSYPVLAERRARIAQNHAVIQAFNDIPIDSTNLRECLSQGRVFSRSEEFPTPDPSRTIRDGVQRLESILPAHQDDLPPTYESLSPPTYSEATKV